MKSFLLVRHQHVLKKLREEISSLCDDDTDLSRADLQNMSYLQNVLEESKLRPLSL